MSAAANAGATVDVTLRALTIGSTCLLVGLLPTTLLILRPHLGAAPAPASPEVLRLRRALAAAVLVAAVAAIASTARLVQVFRSVSPDGSAGAALLEVLRSDLGAWTALRLPAVLALAVVVRATWAFDRPRARYRTGSDAAAWAPLAGLLCLSLPMTSHAWSHGGAAGVAVDAVHIAAGSVWFAGVIALAVIVPAGLRARTTGSRRELLLGSAVAFSKVAVVAVAVTVASGIAQAALGGVRPGEILGTDWGTAATAKLWLFAVVLAAGLLNHRVLIQRLDRARNRVRIQASSSVLLASVSLEVVLGVALVLAAALLVSAPQP
jgi:copper transport protein